MTSNIAIALSIQFGFMNLMSLLAKSYNLYCKKGKISAVFLKYN